jgi:hypothetical protein
MTRVESIESHNLSAQCLCTWLSIPSKLQFQLSTFFTYMIILNTGQEYQCLSHQICYKHGIFY